MKQVFSYKTVKGYVVALKIKNKYYAMTGKFFQLKKEADKICYEMNHPKDNKFIVIKAELKYPSQFMI